MLKSTDTTACKDKVNNGGPEHVSEEYLHSTNRLKRDRVYLLAYKYGE